MTHPVKIFRFCPRCGSARFEVSGSRSLICRDCGFHYYINSAAAVAALIFNSEGKLLVTRRAVEPDIGKIDLPGGFVDPGETAEEALIRELNEELGVTVKRLQYLTSGSNQYLYSGLTVFTTDLVFRVEIHSQDDLIAGDDISSFEWIDPKSVDPEEIPAPSIRYFIKEVAAREMSIPPEAGPTGLNKTTMRITSVSQNSLEGPNVFKQMNNLITKRIDAFRVIMDRENLHALYMSGTDPHRSEYLCEHWQTRKFVTGFSGSSGEVVITTDHIGLWTDTRYFLQAKEQLQGTGIELHKLKVPQAVPVAEWLYSHLKEGERVGADPSSLPVEIYRQLFNRLNDKNIEVVLLSEILDEIWSDRPPQPAEPVFELAESYSGMSRTEKFHIIKENLHQKECDLTIISALDDLAWTYNLRGSDVAYNPVFYGFAIIGENTNMIFTDQSRLPAEIKIKLLEEGIQLSDYKEIVEILSLLSDKLIYIDPGSLNTVLWMAISRNNRINEGISIPSVLKAVKNETEQDGFRQAMTKDGIAMVEFLYWLKKTIGKESISEFTAGRKVAEFRSQMDGFMGESFPPIVGYADHGAVVHLSVDASNANEIKPEGVLLIDSGGHYLCGTTDITRTIAVGPVTSQQKKDFTLVLKGMIALSTAVFLEGTKGMHLDFLARKALYQNGLNYGHGTGHGVGHFLNVHEGPAAIRQEFNPEEIKVGMIFTNEPGLYRKNEYGIRTENMMLCVVRQTTEFGKFLGFETLTLCPIDLSLIDTHLLTPEEILWVNEYHRLVRNRLSPFLSTEAADYLKLETVEI